MPNISSDLKEWGEQGSEYPDGYSYEDDVPPVDVWDDFAMYNIIKDIQNLIDAVNDDVVAADGTTPLSGDLESDKGTKIYDYSEDHLKNTALQYQEISITTDRNIGNVNFEDYSSTTSNVPLGGSIGLELNIREPVRFNQNEAEEMRFENRTDDPSDPEPGQVWLRTDL